jgi:hypothetical protein
MPRFDIGMRVTLERCAGELRAVEQAGVIELVLHAQFTAFKQRLHHAEVGHVAGGEKQRALASRPFGQRFFQRGMFATMAADQMRRPLPTPLASAACFNAATSLRMLRQTQIVVAAERKQAASVAFEPRTVGLRRSCAGVVAIEPARSAV